MPFGLCWLFGSDCLAEVFKSVLAGRVVYKQSGAKHSRAFWVRGAENDVLADFEKLVIFMTKMLCGVML